MFDAVGRIKTELKNGILNREYEYDNIGQLTAEYIYDPAVIALYTDDTTVDRIKLYYVYNINGNLIEQGYAQEWINQNGNVTTSTTVLSNYGYYNSNDTARWYSPLMYDGSEELAYDNMGNPLYYFGKNFTWENGRELVSITNRSTGASIASYEYDASGLRISKTTTSGGTVYYVYDENANLIFEQHSDYTLAFYYDGNGTRTHFTKKSSAGYETYYYRYNLQGDVIALLNNAGTVVAEYNYTAYGKPIGTVTAIGAINPFRYRGYYFDSETGFYYLQSRYYDPNATRFINADAQFDEGAGILQYNLFLYCGNDPVNNVDDSGRFGTPIQWLCAAIGGILGWVFGDFVARAIGLKPNGSFWNRTAYWTVRGLVVAGGAVLGYVAGTKLLNIITKFVYNKGIAYKLPKIVQWFLGISNGGELANDLYKQYVSHIFSKDHIRNGIMKLGSTQRQIFDRIFKIVQSCMSKAKNGDNQILTYINGYKVTIRFYFKDGVINSINAFMGWATRNIGNQIKKW